MSAVLAFAAVGVAIALWEMTYKPSPVVVTPAGNTKRSGRATASSKEVKDAQQEAKEKSSPRQAVAPSKSLTDTSVTANGRNAKSVSQATHPEPSLWQGKYVLWNDETYGINTRILSIDFRDAAAIGNPSDSLESVRSEIRGVGRTTPGLKKKLGMPTYHGSWRSYPSKLVEQYREKAVWDSPKVAGVSSDHDMADSRKGKAAPSVKPPADLAAPPKPPALPKVSEPPPKDPSNFMTDTRDKANALRKQAIAQDRAARVAKSMGDCNKVGNLMLRTKCMSDAARQ